MFYLWESLLNLNELPLGTRQDGTTVNHVHLPKWARGNAWRLTRTLRQALESPHVSREIPGWIDLIFGALQQGDGAAAALNLFLPCTYVNAVDLSTLDDADRAAILSQIQLVGQTPEQLWATRKHPSRSTTAALNTVPLSPLLVQLTAGHKLTSNAEHPSGPVPVYGVLVGAGGERATPLPRDALCVPRAQLVVRWGYRDGSLRFYRQRAFANALALPALQCVRLHGGERIITCCVSSDGTWIATGDQLGGLAVWRLRHRSTPLSLRSHGKLNGHSAAVIRVCCSGAHRSLASVSADGLMMMWDLRRCLLLHVIRINPPPSPSPTLLGGGAACEELPLSTIPAACAIDETGETLIATTTELQLWSVNGSLLAASHQPFGSTCSACTLLKAPEWMVEQLPICATGHHDGTVRFWSIREPLSGCILQHGTVSPRAISRLPIRSVWLPTWELYEMRALRLEKPAGGSSGTEGGEVTAVCVGEGYEKLLWTANADGRVRAWKAPPQAVAEKEEGEEKKAEDKAVAAATAAASMPAAAAEQAAVL